MNEVVARTPAWDELIGEMSTLLREIRDLKAEVQRLKKPGALPKKEAAKYCGISVSTLDREAHKSKLLKRVRVGSGVGFRIMDLDAWLESKLEKDDDGQSAET